MSKIRARRAPTMEEWKGVLEKLDPMILAKLKISLEKCLRRLSQPYVQPDPSSPQTTTVVESKEVESDLSLPQVENPPRLKDNVPEEEKSAGDEWDVAPPKADLSITDATIVAEDRDWHSKVSTIHSTPAEFIDVIVAEKGGIEESMAGLSDEVCGWSLTQGVDKSLLLRKLVGNREWFDPGGRIHNKEDGEFTVMFNQSATQWGSNDFDKRKVHWLADDFQRNENIDLLMEKQALQRLTVPNRVTGSLVGKTKGKQTLIVAEYADSPTVDKFSSLPIVYMKGKNVKKGLLLTPVHEGNELFWRGSVAVPNGFECEYNYYVVDDKKNVLRWGTGKRRQLLLPDGVMGGDTVEFHDLWQTGSDALAFRSAFKDVIFRRTWNREIQTSCGFVSAKSFHDCNDVVIVQFKVSCTNLPDNTSVCMIGGSSKLGNWKIKDGHKLSYAGDSIRKTEVVIPVNDFLVNYRYCKGDCGGHPSLEAAPNRVLSVDSLNKPTYIVKSYGLLRELPWRGAGVAIPMFSVRSDADLGVGEFLDLKLLIDWAVASGFHLVQLLPINDTSVNGMWWDSYPYSSLSVFALHPLYLRVQAISENIPDAIKQEISKAKEQLDGKAVDYEATMSTKISIAKKIFALEKDRIFLTTAFQKFFAENEGWLKPYAAFCFLRDFFETSDHSQWGRFSNYSNEKLEKLVSEDSLHYDIIRFHYFIQFHLHIQLSEAADYARSKGVVLKGDLPIGVDRNSVDTWVYPTLFRMNTSTGAPPDYFDKNGQNWGFPTYNWEEMSKDNYAWWRGRLSQMAKYFTAYRIDHILGFFRIWELPDHAMTGLCGKFRPSIPLSQEELEKEGFWDFDRLSRPYILAEHLQEKFGDAWTLIASTFLNEFQQQRYEFKEDSDTEKKIAAKLKTYAEKSLLPDTEINIRRHLFGLLQDIVLIRDPEDSRKFYPRFNLEETLSFSDLDDHSKNVLKRLYYDYYFCRQENLWRQNALKTLPALLKSSDMLACGEDLGFIPSCVHPVMQELGLIGLRIQRMPNESDLEFGIPSRYSYMTVCAPSCHDCSTMRVWWEEDEERRLRFYKAVVGSDELPPSKCVPGIAKFILQQHVEAPSMWAIFPLQDLLALKEDYTTRPATEETINDPTNPKHYWRYRVHVTLESLLDDTELTSSIKDLVQSSGRSCPPAQADTKPAKEAAPTKTPSNLEKDSVEGSSSSQVNVTPSAVAVM